MRLTVVHETCYRHEAPVLQSTQILRMTPPDLPGQQVVAWRLLGADLQDLGEDGFGNRMHLLSVAGEHQQVCVKAFGTVDIEAMPVRAGDGLSPYLFLRPTDLTTPDDNLRDFSLRYAGRALTPARLRDLSAAVLAQLPQAVRPGARVLSASESWETGKGGSAEQTQALLTVCHLLGLPARYVSGYVFREEAAGLRVSGHAWAEVWLADAWHGVDVALQAPVGERHIRLAIGRDHLDACPMRSIGHGNLHAGSLLPVAGRGDMALAQVVVMQQQQQ